MVYEALDKERRLHVALKTLPRLSPDALYRFKQEFRSLADIVHPNLISLYELFAEGEQWFFTMEFVQGIEFARSVRTTTSSFFPLAQPTRSSAQFLPTSEQATLSRAAAARIRPDSPPSAIVQSEEPGDSERIRELLRQVAEGLSAVHAAGKMHRDIKSSNVLVTSDDRAVLLDFGLAAELEEAGRAPLPGEIVGTILFMSPEQGDGAPLTPASDWYSVGVMLYQGLTGQMPFRGATADVMKAKRAGALIPPHQLVPSVPQDLNRLCLDLLRARPEERPGAAEVLARLGEVAGPPRRVAVLKHRPARGAASVFVGREAEEKRLLEALTAACAGSAAVALVHGPSGLGKSSLIAHFLERPELSDALVLRGRCYEQESVPYKALDSAMDALSRFLRRLLPEQIPPLLPEDAGPLMQVFPVLQQVQPAALASARTQESADPQALRRRAFHAFGEIFRRVRSRQPVVLYLDDLQWGDRDSALLLAELLAPPDPPPLLVVCSYRSEHAEASPFLEAFLGLRERGGALFFDISVEPLGPEVARALAAKLLAESGAPPAELHARAARISQESGGNPYFLLELAQGAAAESAEPGDSGQPLALEELIWRRISALPAPAQRLLQVVTVSGRPLAQQDVYTVAGFDTRDPAPFSLLRHANLIRTTGARGLDQVESFHDRVRETVVGRLAPDSRRELHRGLATTLESSGRADVETLAFHFEHGGSPVKASGYYESAAGEAAAALAFDRSAQLYEHALELGEHPAEKRHSLQVRLAEAFANAGRGARAAEEFERAVDGASPGARLDLERSAAFHYCSSGHLNRGMELSRRTLARVGLKISPSRRVTFLKVVGRSLALQLHGARFREHPQAEISPKRLDRFDTAWAMAAPMVQADLLEALNFGTFCLAEGRALGDPVRLVRGTLVGAYQISVQGRRARRLAERFVQLSENYARRANDPRLIAYVELSKMAIAYICAEWRSCREHALVAERILTRECPGSRWEVSSLWTLYLYSLWSEGGFVELAERTPSLLREADDRGDLYSFSNLQVFCEPLVHLAADRPVQAGESIRSGIARWTGRGMDVQHVMAAEAEMWVSFYQGHAVERLEFALGNWTQLRRNHFDAHPNLRTNWLDYVARSALAVAAGPRTPRRERDAALLLARRMARALAAHGSPWGQATAPAIFAGLAALAGEAQRAVEFWLESAGRFEAADMLGYAASAHRLAGEFLGGDQGRALIAHADEWFQSQEIVRPDRMAAAHLGGYLN